MESPENLDDRALDIDKYFVMWIFTPIMEIVGVVVEG